jgi:hypothetical protein
MDIAARRAANSRRSPPFSLSTICGPSAPPRNRRQHLDARAQPDYAPGTESLGLDTKRMTEPNRHNYDAASRASGEEFCYLTTMTRSGRPHEIEIGLQSGVASIFYLAVGMAPTG